MEHSSLIAAARKAAKSENKRLKRENKLPAVVYGKGYETTSIAVDERELNKILRTRGESSLINLTVLDQTFPVLVKEIQRNLLKDSIDHVDFFKVSMDEEVEYNLPIVLKGEAEGIKEGGILQHQKREVTVKSLPGDMLDILEVDVSALVIGDTLTVSDLNVDDKNTILDDFSEVIVTLLAPVMEEEEEEEVEVEATEEGEEPKLIGADEDEEEK